jgi:hypothetical protein
MGERLLQMIERDRGIFLDRIDHEAAIDAARHGEIGVQIGHAVAMAVTCRHVGLHPLS